MLESIFYVKGAIILSEAILGLGTNLGNRKENLIMAVQALSNVPKIKILNISNIYETVPFNVPDIQKNYLNCCVKIFTDLSPHTLLGLCLGIEVAMGRKRLFKFCSRIIDIDLIAYGDLICNDTDLILPHPKITERAFVMVPLNDICQNQRFYNLDFSKKYSDINFSKYILNTINLDFSL